MEGGRGVGRGVCGSGRGLLSPLNNWACVVPPLLLVGGRKGPTPKHENEGGAILDLKYENGRVWWVNELSPYFLLLPPFPRIDYGSWPAWGGVGAPRAVDFGCPKGRKPRRHPSAESGQNDRGRQKNHPNHVVSLVKEVLANKWSYSDRKSTQRAPRSGSHTSPTSQKPKRRRTPL